MPIYHLSAKILSRQDGRNVVAAAAYRSGTRLTDLASGITHDYTRKPGVLHSEIVAPPWAPEWTYDRQTLWNAVENAERRKDAQLARELEIALPVELQLNDHIDLVREYVTAAVVARGMVADASIHRTDNHNPHVHVLLSTRVITAAGFAEKARTWSEVETLLNWRREWAERVNAFMIKVGVTQRIDQRSLSAQGTHRTAGKKIGVA